MNLDRQRILVEAPLRVDFGGTIDVAEIASALAEERPCTFNIAIGPGIALDIGPCSRELNIVSGHGGRQIALPGGVVPPKGSPHRLVFGTLAQLGAVGVHVRIRPSVRPGSGLGGSGTLCCALVFGVLALRGGELIESPAFRMKCAIRAQAIEHGLGESITGLQDQLAAAFGGVNLWHWRSCDDTDWPVMRSALCAGELLDEHLLVCELPSRRQSSIATGQFLRSLHCHAHRDSWSRLNSLTEDFADCVVRQDWRRACALSSTALTLRQALANGCAAGFGGGNVDGSLWTIGPKESIRRLGAWICRTDQSGIRVLAIRTESCGARISALPV
jgi:D-glycero-alpha-D-manno-heptose-7-phosphate kinase